MKKVLLMTLVAIATFGAVNAQNVNLNDTRLLWNQSVVNSKSLLVE